jgi:outer membrane scaffolding protein for murein synthesis (MipA/OmpV family)
VAGRDHDGARLDLGVQRLAAVLGERHRVSLSAGVGIVNARYNDSYFGVTPEEARAAASTLTSRAAACRTCMSAPAGTGC